MEFHLMNHFHSEIFITTLFLYGVGFFFSFSFFQANFKSINLFLAVYSLQKKTLITTIVSKAAMSINIKLKPFGIQKLSLFFFRCFFHKSLTYLIFY